MTTTAKGKPMSDDWMAIAALRDVGQDEAADTIERLTAERDRAREERDKWIEHAKFCVRQKLRLTAERLAADARAQEEFVTTSREIEALRADLNCADARVERAFRGGWRYGLDRWDCDEGWKRYCAALATRPDTPEKP